MHYLQVTGSLGNIAHIGYSNGILLNHRPLIRHSIVSRMWFQHEREPISKSAKQEHKTPVRRLEGEKRPQELKHENVQATNRKRSEEISEHHN